jgi:hypothetical protein
MAPGLRKYLDNIERLPVPPVVEKLFPLSSSSSSSSSSSKSASPASPLRHSARLKEKPKKVND